MRSFRGFRIFIFILGLCCFTRSSNAQSNDQAQMRGTVSDSSGAVIPHAGVTLTDIGTNVSQKTVSNDHGLYVFTALPASNYRMLIEAPGFGPVEKPGIVLAVNQQTTLNVTLAPAAANTSVTVQSVPVLLDADNATLGTDIGEKYLTQIPLENRDPFGLVFLAAGVTESAGSGINDSYPCGNKFRFQWAKKFHCRNSPRRHAHHRTGAGRGRHLEYLLPGYGRGPAGSKGPEQ